MNSARALENHPFLNGSWPIAYSHNSLMVGLVVVGGEEVKGLCARAMLLHQLRPKVYWPLLFLPLHFRQLARLFLSASQLTTSQRASQLLQLYLSDFFTLLAPLLLQPTYCTCTLCALYMAAHSINPNRQPLLLLADGELAKKSTNRSDCFQYLSISFILWPSRALNLFCCHSLCNCCNATLLLHLLRVIYQTDTNQFNGR